MKIKSLQVLSYFFVILMNSALAQAGDLSALKECVTEGYKNLPNRHAIVVAVVDADAYQTMTFGTANLNQIFEIGSITKTFTAELLAQAIEEGTLKLSDSIPSEYQKAGFTITYQNLTTHTSGLMEGIFPAFKITNSLSPFEGLTIPMFKSLYAQTPLAAPPNSTWQYSNIGVSLLGLVLTEKLGPSYEALVTNRILKKLGMNETYFEVPASELNRFPIGYAVDSTGKSQSMPHWDLFKTAINPAGGLRSTISDMVKYTQANLTPASTSLAASIKLSQQPLYFIKDHNMWMGMNWILQPNQGLIWHNGETYGFNSILAISTTRQQAIVAMTDTTVQIKNAQGEDVYDTGLQDVAFKCLK